MRRRKKKQTSPDERTDQTEAVEGGSADAREGPADDADEVIDVAELLAERAALEDKLRRALADMANMRRRQAEDVRRASENSLGRIAQEILPIMDSFELAIGAASDAPNDSATLLEGVRMVHSMLEDLLGRHGVEPIDAEGAPFDPKLHEAIGLEPRDDVDPNTIVAVHQTGFRIGDRVLRPTRVVVSQQVPEHTPEPPAGDDGGQDQEPGETDPEESGTSS